MKNEKVKLTTCQMIHEPQSKLTDCMQAILLFGGSAIAFTTLLIMGV